MIESLSIESNVIPVQIMLQLVIENELRILLRNQFKSLPLGDQIRYTLRDSKKTPAGNGWYCPVSPSAGVFFLG
jgi:hypothetical protein